MYSDNKNKKFEIFLINRKKFTDFNRLFRMQRPGQKITRKTIMMHKKMKDLDKKDISSKSLLVNVMDMDDDFRWGGNAFP